MSLPPSNAAGEQHRSSAAFEQGDAATAITELRLRLEDDPLDADAYRSLAAAKKAVRQQDGTAGQLHSATVSGAHFRLAQAELALRSDDLPKAESILRARLLDEPTDVQALRMMAEFANRLGLQEGSEQLLRYVIELMPGLAAVKLDLAKQLYLRASYDEALALISDALDLDADNMSTLFMKAVVLGHAARFEEALAIYEGLVRQTPDDARLWAGYGRSLKTIGRSAEGIDAFRRATVVNPSLGEAWWSLSDLKTVRFDDNDVATMGRALSEELADKDRYYIHFALGRAFEQRREYEKSFGHYAEGNRLHRSHLDYDPEHLTEYVTASRHTFSADFFETRKGAGDASLDPIFILGMSRAGSTLIEQILSSHPAIEGTMELPNVAVIATSLSNELIGRIDAIAALDPARFADLGAQYVRDTRRYRKTNRRFFVDKMPNNWLLVPLIHLMLPNARIIDARRHPMACCFSNYKQNYARGQAFSYDLADLGAYYSNYVRMMAHVDEVLPGKVHRVFHEDLVDDTEAVIRRLLNFIDLPFDARCLRFHETERAVRTASAEQVRRPINREGVDQWRDYEQWLKPLKEALGPVLFSYPETPPFDR